MQRLKELWEETWGSILFAWNAVLDQIQTISHQLSELDLLGTFELFVICFGLLLVSLFIVGRIMQLRSSLPPGHYFKNPTMVQGRVGTLALLVSFGIIGALMIAVVTASDIYGVGPDLAATYAPWLIRVGFFYVFACLLGFFVWAGVSRAEVVIVDGASISFRHMFTSNRFLNLFQVMVYSVAWLVFSIVVRIATFWFLMGFMKIDFKEWIDTIRAAGKFGGRNISSGGITGTEYPERSLLLQQLGIGHVIVNEEGRSPLEIRYMPSFDDLESAIKRITRSAN